MHQAVRHDGHIASARAALLTSNQRQHIDAIARDLLRSTHLRNASRSINHEAARTAVRPMRACARSTASLVVMLAVRSARGLRSASACRLNT
jgi:hypothetical protein